jgi:hypothetical protein
VRHNDDVSTVLQPLAEIISERLSGSEDEDVGRFEVALLVLARNLEELLALKSAKQLRATHKLALNSIDVRIKAIRRGGAVRSIEGEVAVAQRAERDIARRASLARRASRVTAALAHDPPPSTVQQRDIFVRRLQRAAEIYQFGAATVEELIDGGEQGARAFVASFVGDYHHVVAGDRCWACALGVRLREHLLHVAIVLATWSPVRAGRPRTGTTPKAVARDELLDDLLGALGLAVSASALKSARRRARRKTHSPSR